MEQKAASPRGQRIVNACDVFPESTCSQGPAAHQTLLPILITPSNPQIWNLFKRRHL